MRNIFGNYFRSSYVLAIVIIALISIVIDSWLLVGGINRLESAAFYANVAGKQRALTERLSGLFGELLPAESPPLIAELRGQLKETISEFEQAHMRLIGEPGSLPGSLHELFFQEPEAVDYWMREYAGTARALLALPVSELVPGNPQWQLIQNNRATMFERLDKVATQFQFEEELRVRQLRWLALWVNAAIVLLLASTAIFIFLPMEKRVLTERRGLKAANRELDTVLALERRQRHELASLYEFAEQTLRDRDPLSLMQSAADYLFNTLPIQAARIYAFDPGAQSLVVRAKIGVKESQFGTVTISTEPGSKGAMLLAADGPVSSAEPDFDAWPEELGIEQGLLGSQVVAVPVRGRQHAFGVVLVMADLEHPAGKEEMQYIHSLASLLGVACESIDLDQNLHRMQRDLRVGTRNSATAELGISLAHELNQPLTAIMNYASACRQLTNADNNVASDGQSIQVNGLLEKLVGEAGRAGNIIKEMRNYLETREHHEAGLDVNELIRDSVLLARTEVVAEGVSMGWLLDPDLPKGVFSKLQLQQVLFNLLHNAALDTLDADEREVTVVSRRYNEGMIEIAVEDTGAGEYASFLNQSAYTPFVDKSYHMGLGLSVCKSIINQYGGQIWASRALPPAKTSSAVHFTLFTERG